MNLILIRHARAFERDPAAWPDDSRRPLTATGREQFRVLAKRLGRAVREVEIVEVRYEPCEPLPEHLDFSR